MPLTPFQKHKIRRLFSVLDVNRDGRVDRNDYVRRVQALAKLSGWAEGSPEYERNLHYVLQEWESVRDSADLNDSGAVTVDEFLRYADIYLDDPDAVSAYARADVQLLFDAMDTDADNAITVNECRAYLKACRVAHGPEPPPRCGARARTPAGRWGARVGAGASSTSGAFASSSARPHATTTSSRSASRRRATCGCTPPGTRAATSSSPYRKT